jgi:hypothetical protein
MNDSASAGVAFIAAALVFEDEFGPCAATKDDNNRMMAVILPKK